MQDQHFKLLLKLKIIMNENKLKQLKIEPLFNFFIQNPIWISAFTVGQGSFTASVSLDLRAKWGMWPQCEFNITQLMQDKLLLQAINLYFNNTGGVYSRQNGVGTVSFRDLTALQNAIIPYFNKYPLLGVKSLAFQHWVRIVHLVCEKNHLSDTLKARDSLVNILLLLRSLNSSNTRNSKNKLNRNTLILNWLYSLNQVPTQEQKENLLKQVKG